MKKLISEISKINKIISLNEGITIVNEQSMGGFLSPDTVSKNLVQSKSEDKKKLDVKMKTEPSLKSQIQSVLNELKKYYNSLSSQDKQLIVFR